MAIESPTGTSLQSIGQRFESGREGPVALGVGCSSRSLLAGLPPSAGAVGSGSLVFPAPSMALARHQADLRGLPFHPGSSPIGFDLSVPPTASPLLQSSLSAPGRTLLSWDSSTCAPPPTYRRASTPGDVSASFGRAVPPTRSRSASVVSRHLDGLLRASVAGLLRPATGLGFAAFPRWCPLPVGRRLPRIPATRPTLRRIPLVSSRTASPRPLPSCPCRPFGSARPASRASLLAARTARLPACSLVDPLGCGRRCRPHRSSPSGFVAILFLRRVRGSSLVRPPILHRAARGWPAGPNRR